MGFIGRVSYPDCRPPIKLYIHESVTGAYGEKPIVEARQHFIEVFGKYKERFSRCNFLLASIWGIAASGNVEPGRFIDIFGYSGIGKWPGNLDVTSWVSEHGELIPSCFIKEREDYPVSCEDTVIAFGKEGSFRRQIENPNLETFMKTWPEILGFYFQFQEISEIKI